MVNSGAIFPQRRVFTLAVVALLVALSVSVASAASASILARVSLDTLRTRSDVVAIGRVVASRPVFLDGTIQTETFVAIERSFRGPASGTLRLLTLGGSIGGTRLTVAGSPSFSPDERVLVFLYEGPSGLRPVGMFQGVWRFAPERVDVRRPKPRYGLDAEETIDDADDLPFDMVWPSSSGGASLVDLEPGPYAVDGGPRTLLGLLGELTGGNR